jgi:hypothetical protein
MAGRFECPEMPEWLLDIKDAPINGNCQGMSPVYRIQLLHDAPDMKLDRPFTYVENYRRLPVALPFLYPEEDFVFPG